MDIIDVIIVLIPYSGRVIYPDDLESLGIVKSGEYNVTAHLNTRLNTEQKWAFP